jgi:hypothetical protein
MQRQSRLPFSVTPERLITDTDEIELVNMADLDVHLAPEEAPDESPSLLDCYAIYYAMQPFIAATNAVRESLDDAAIYNDPQSLCERLSNVCEYAQTTIAAPVAYSSAALVSVVGFFGGAARDIYEAASYYLTPEEESDNSASNTP